MPLINMSQRITELTSHTDNVVIGIKKGNPLLSSYSIERERERKREKERVRFEPTVNEK